MTETGSHTGHADGAHEMAQDALLPIEADGSAPLATHVAVNNGDWFNPATWANGEVPGDGALVHIPAGVSVAYEGESDASLFIVRVDGALSMFADNGVETKMVVDTMITSMDSSLTIDADDASSGTVDIVFAEGTPAAHADHYEDTSPGDGVLGRSSWDPEQLSLGLVASGTVDIKGQAVEAGLSLASGPAAGATELVFDSLDGGTFGWEAGQKVVVGGAKYLARDGDGVFQTQDEVREITDVRVENGQMIVTLDSPLEHDHRGPSHPDTGAELTVEVGNLSRNVTFSSAAADGDGDGIPDHPLSYGDDAGPSDHYATERGHVMFMHNDDVTLANSAMFGLGRTDKSEPLDDFLVDDVQNNRLHEDNGVIGQYDPDLDIEIQTPADEITNQRGRYAIHIHQAGTGSDDHGDHSDHGVIGPCPDSGGPICQCGDQDGDGIADCEDEDFVDGAYISGNAVWGSPGWGIVQHSSAAVLDGNLVFDANGSAFVAESGDETGRWEDNLAIGTYGDRGRVDFEDSADFNEDDGIDGIGFYLKARAIEVVDNTAISSARSGFFYHQNGSGLLKTPADDLGELANIAHGLDAINTEDVPIRGFEGNTVIGSQQALRIATDPLDAVRKFNDAYSLMKDFTAWEADEAGVRITYSSKYVFDNFLIMGTEDKVTADGIKASAGFYFGASVADITVVNSHVEEFAHVVTNWNLVGNRQEYRRGYWDPKSPSPNEATPDYEGMGHVEGIENAAYNLWNTNVVGISFDNVGKIKIRSPKIEVETENGEVEALTPISVVKTAIEKAHIDIELLGDSRDGGLVALWREDIATHPDQAAMLQEHIPLAYQDSVYLSKIYFEDGSRVKRDNFLEYEEGINADIWSGTALEFAKEDSLGRHVFLYGDFSPLDPSAIERTMTTNEKILFTKDMINGVLEQDGYYHVNGVTDVLFVVMKMIFSDRLTGNWETKEFLVALDQAWELPEGATDAGILVISEDLIVAEEYRVFDNGVLVEGREPIDLGDLPRTVADFASQGGFIPPAPEEEPTVESEDSSGPPEAAADPVAASNLPDAPGEDAETSADEPAEQTGTQADAGAQAPAEATPEAAPEAAPAEPDAEAAAEPAPQADPAPAPAPEPVVTANPAPTFGPSEAFANRSVYQEIEGIDGDDVLHGSHQNDDISAGKGYDKIYAHSGDDEIHGGRGFDLLNGGNGDDVLHGDEGKDILLGANGNDRLDGGTWDDKLYGGNGNDQLEGGRGRDILHGGADDDNLEGGEGSDLLSGGTGDDRLNGGTQDDRMTGGSGRDVFVFEKEAGTDVITDFEDGVDSIEFLIQGFGFDDIAITRDAGDAVITHEEGSIRLLDTDADSIDRDDFLFGQAN